MMNNLQPLNWQRIDREKLAGIYCEKTESYIKDVVSFCSTPVANYVIRQDKETGKYSANYGGRNENTYDTIDEAECWAEHTHYKDKMQPYVKPMPTWIGVDDKLPEASGSYLTFNGYDMKVNQWNKNGWLLIYEGVMITDWMPIPEFTHYAK